MNPAIIRISEKKIIGFKSEMTLAENRATSLWAKFMPLKHQLKNTVGSELYAVQEYNQHLKFELFDHNTTFIQWAAVEVSSYEKNFNNMDHLVISEGIYAKFIHRGTAQMFQNTMNSIMQDWLPSSGFILDTRPHFQIMLPGYDPNDPEASEEVWIPVKKL